MQIDLLLPFFFKLLGLFSYGLSSNFTLNFIFILIIPNDLKKIRIYKFQILPARICQLTQKYEIV